MDIAGVTASTGKRKSGLRDNLGIRKSGRTTRSACTGTFAILLQLTLVVSFLLLSCSTAELVCREAWKREYP